MVKILSLGNINLSLLEKTFGKLQYGKQCVQNPDYIIKDCKNENTVFMIMKLPNTNLNVVSRLALETDKNGLKNSVMTFYRIRKRNLKKLIDKNAVLYSKE